MRRERPDTVQTALRLPREMHERLKQSPDGVSEEIRRRLERTFDEDSFDQQTRDFAAAVMWMADQIQRDTASSWHLRPKTHEALAEAVQTYLATIKPRLETGVAVPGASDLMFDFDPQTLGHAVARHYMRFKEELRKSEQELRQLHKGEKP